MSTLKQLAQLAGVSIATVSRALNDDPHVLPTTRQRILDLANLYHYHPNRLAHGFLSGKSGAIGCIIPSINSGYYSRILRGVVEYAFAESYHVIILQAMHRADFLQRAVETLLEQRVEGMLIATGDDVPIPKTVLYGILSQGIIPVSMDTTETEIPIDHIHTDEDKFGELAIDHLADLGHREIAYIGYKHKELRGRALGVYNALRKHKLSTEHMLLDHAIIDQEFLKRLFQRKPRPTAIATHFDEMAAVIIQQCTYMGIHVPRDVSIVGCGNLHFAEILLPPLTTIEQYPEQIGRRAAEFLVQSFQAKVSSEAHQPATIVVTPSLVVRKSCAPPPTRAESR
ncbi:MAG TPA: LacI family DNA-binding transcriptional regulator [Armatimonadota bacterium]|jgi:DNA-binding LacI/PurR family transcriptional regulator